MVIMGGSLRTLDRFKYGGFLRQLIKRTVWEVIRTKTRLEEWQGRTAQQFRKVESIHRINLSGV